MSDLFEREPTAEREQFRQEHSRQQLLMAREKSRRRTKWTIAAVILAGLILIIGGSSISTYNGLVKKREVTQEKWSQVENVMQRRADLIPNLVDTVKGVTQQELDVFSRIAEARSRLLSSGATPEQQVQANDQIRRLSFQVLSLVEQYPELRSNESFNRLMDELAGAENRIAVARRDYIQAVQDYNVTTSQFPTVVMARLLGFEREQDYFQATDAARETPQVDFSR
jgi:LemA protein